MIMFMGEFNHSVDAKGRVIVPSKFRDKLGESFVVTKGFDRCLSIYDMENWTEVQEKLVKMPMLTEDSRTIRRMMAGSAAEAECDKQGRVLIPAPLREYAGIKKDAVINVYPYGTITKSEVGEELSDIDKIKDKVIAFSDDGKGVQKEEIMPDKQDLEKVLNSSTASFVKSSTSCFAFSIP